MSKKNYSIQCELSGRSSVEQEEEKTGQVKGDIYSAQSGAWVSICFSLLFRGGDVITLGRPLISSRIGGMRMDLSIYLMEGESIKGNSVNNLRERSLSMSVG